MYDVDSYTGEGLVLVLKLLGVPCKGVLAVIQIRFNLGELLLKFLYILTDLLSQKYYQTQFHKFLLSNM
jgi:hypothetical protein